VCINRGNKPMKPFSRLQASLIVSSIILAPYTFGQLLAEELSPVVVSATRSTQSLVTTPSSITIITSDDIENSGASNIAEVLNTQASIQLNDLFGNGSRVQVSMRGFADNAKSNVLILVDGRRLNNPDLAAPDLSGVVLQKRQKNILLMPKLKSAVSTLKIYAVPLVTKLISWATG